MNLDELIDEIRKSDKVTFVIGSSTITTKTTKEYVTKLFDGLLMHYFFDEDFYMNWIDDDEMIEYRDLYENRILPKLINNLEMIRYFDGKVEIKKDRNYQSIIDEHFLTYRDVMSSKLFNSYKEYRLAYAEVDITK